MSVHYLVEKQRGSSRYYVKISGEKLPLRYFKDKRKAIRYASSCEGLSKEEYMKRIKEVSANEIE